MTDHTDQAHIDEQMEIWRLVHEAFDERHRREPLFCPRCALDGLVIANIVGFQYMLAHAESAEDRREIEVALAATEMARASRQAEHRA